MASWIYFRPLRRRFQASPCSCAGFVALVFFLLKFGVPILFCSYTYFWFPFQLSMYKKANVTASHDYFFSISDVSNDDIEYYTNNQNLVSYLNMTSYDGLKDIYDQDTETLTISNFLLDSNTNIQPPYYLSFMYFPKIEIKNEINVRTNAIIMISQVVYSRQTAIECYGEFEAHSFDFFFLGDDVEYLMDWNNPSKIIAYDLTIPSLLKKINNDNVSFSYLHSCQTNFSSSGLSLTVHIKNNPVFLQYRPSFLQLLKYGWMRYLTYVLIFYFILDWIEEMIFENQIVTTTVMDEYSMDGNAQDSTLKGNTYSYHWYRKSHPHRL